MPKCGERIILYALISRMQRCFMRSGLRVQSEFSAHPRHFLADFRFFRFEYVAARNHNQIPPVGGDGREQQTQRFAHKALGAVAFSREPESFFRDFHPEPALRRHSVPDPSRHHPALRVAVLREHAFEFRLRTQGLRAQNALECASLRSVSGIRLAQGGHGSSGGGG